VHLAKVTYAIQTKSIGSFNSGVISVIFMALKEQTVLHVCVHEIRMQCPIVCMKALTPLRLRFPAFSSVQRRCRRSWCAFAAFDRLFGDSVRTGLHSVAASVMPQQRLLEEPLSDARCSDACALSGAGSGCSMLPSCCSCDQCCVLWRHAYSTSSEEIGRKRI